MKRFLLLFLLSLCFYEISGFVRNIKGNTFSCPTLSTGAEAEGVIDLTMAEPKVYRTRVECLKECERLKQTNNSAINGALFDFYENGKICQCLINLTRYKWTRYFTYYQNGIKNNTKLPKYIRRSGRALTNGFANATVLPVAKNSTITINNCTTRCQELNSTYGDISAFSIKALGSIRHAYSRLLNVTECTCLRNPRFGITDLKRTCFFSPLETPRCKWFSSKIPEARDTFPRPFGELAVNFSTCMIECRRIQLDREIPVFGVMMDSLYAGECRCTTEKKRYSRFSCILRNGGKCNLHSGLPVSNGTIMMSEKSMPVRQCIELCIEAKKNNSAISGVEMKDIIWTNRCICHLNATMVRTYRSCFFDNLPQLSTVQPATVLPTTNTSMSTTDTKVLATISPPPEQKESPQQVLKTVFKIFNSTDNITICRSDDAHDNCTTLEGALTLLNCLVFNQTQNFNTTEKGGADEKIRKEFQQLTLSYSLLANSTTPKQTQKLAPIMFSAFDQISFSPALRPRSSPEEEQSQPDTKPKPTSTSTQIKRTILQTIDTVVRKVMEVPSLSLDIGLQNMAIKIESLDVTEEPGNKGVREKEIAVHSSENGEILLIKMTTLNEDISMTDLSAIKVPKTALPSNQSKISVASVVYKNDLFFAQSVGKTTNQITDRVSGSVGSVIHSLIVGQQEIKDLFDPIKLIFKTNQQMKRSQQKITNTTCSFWVEDSNHQYYWSDQGCKTVNQTIDHVICQCNHLTNFAILFDVQQTAQHSPSSKGLEIMTKIGCGVSIAGLTLTVFFHLFIAKLRTKLHSHILISLSSSLIMLLALFVLFAEKWSSMSRLSCQLVAGGIHFFLLSSFAWMIVEGYNLHSSIVSIFLIRGGERFFWWALSFSIVIPAGLVGSNYALYPQSLGNERFCVVHGPGFYMFILAPIIFTIIFNAVILVRIIHTIRKSDKKFKNKKSRPEDENIRLKMIRIAFTCSCIMGLSWIFGIFAIEDASVVFQWLFTIFNSLQGFFIFVMHTLRNKEIQNQIRNCQVRAQGANSLQNSPKSLQSQNTINMTLR
eukprot:TCONS_00012210-protein